MFSTALYATAMIATAASDSSQSMIEKGRSLSTWSSVQSMKSLIDAAAPQLREVMEKGGGAAAMGPALTDHFGMETKVLDEFSITLNGLVFYQRLSNFAKVPAGLTSLVWDSQGIVQAATVRAAAPSPTPGERFEVGLPFSTPNRGQWFTFWGGPNEARNYHIVAKDQTYAYDFVVVKDGRSYDGPADRNSSYYCWDEPALAPADGVVTSVVSGIQDNVPGKIEPVSVAAGNHVVIQHARSVHSLIAHLQSGSVLVQKGDEVKAGQRVGSCGNSGRSSEPHVHFHLQTTGTFGGDAVGIPPLFRDIQVDGRDAKPGEPIRGQFVDPAR
ncbi:M23 family metallopeptidase [Sphingosinicella rhizophila]|uniref:M23 family metallopeptidase n=1 Tax=Sphingosinicella rhizophila TaxID=3050082 RepID=A0ABU3QAR4_9SPHN|nr:M23 family metallopeptidase [Sphingosinicella sp. GR2756]MDT9600501.1 M23 family metallopeptidase [Sphingosinicella sp. GR2756]